MQVQNNFFAPQSTHVTMLMQALAASVESKPNTVVKNVQFEALFNTTKKVDNQFESFRFSINSSGDRAIVNHAQDPDGPCVTQEEIDQRREPELQMLEELITDLEDITSNVDTIARCYRFFMEVAKNLLNATHVRELEITVTDSNRRLHVSQHIGNFVL